MFPILSTRIRIRSVIFVVTSHGWTKRERYLENAAACRENPPLLLQLLESKRTISASKLEAIVRCKILGNREAFPRSTVDTGSVCRSHFLFSSLSCERLTRVCEYAHGRAHYKTDYESGKVRNSDPRAYHAVQSSRNRDQRMSGFPVVPDARNSCAFLISFEKRCIADVSRNLRKLIRRL